MKTLYPYFTYAGALPFILCALGFIFEVNTVPVLGDTKQVLSVYALVISSFIAGSHWGQHLSLNNKWSLYLPLFSNIMAIILWVAFLILSFKHLLLAFILSFFVLLMIDKKLLQEALVDPEYFRTRVFVTTIVTITLVISRIYA
jgi:hypothetical protein